MYSLSLLKTAFCRRPINTKLLIQTFTNDSIKICSLKIDRIEETIKFMSDNFLKHENVCKAVGIASNPKILSELEDYIALHIEDGVSLIAIDTTTDKVIGAAINSLMCKENVYDDDLKLEEVSSKWKHSETHDIVDFWTKFGDNMTVFDYLKVDCVLELTFYAVLSKYQKAGVGKRLLDSSVFLGKQLNKGENVKQSVNDKILTLEQVPEGVVSICTSSVAQKGVKAYGFNSIFRKSYQSMKVNGKSMSEMVQDAKFIKVYYLSLK